MDKNEANAIKRARLQAGYTQEKTAELSGYSVDSIQAWEGGTRRPTLEALGILEETFSAPWLTAIYLKEQYNTSLHEAIPAFTPGESLPQAVMALLEAVYTFSDQNSDRRLISIAADGKIDDGERGEFDAIMGKLQKIIEAAVTVRYAKQE